MKMLTQADMPYPTSRDINVAGALQISYSRYNNRYN